MDYRETSGRQIQELSRSFRLRPARAGESQALSTLALRSKAHWGYDAAFMADCVGELTWSENDIATGTVWVAVNDAGAVLGFCDLRLAGECLEVDALYVDPAAMGAGAGRALWQKAETTARDLNAWSIALEADPNALGFYQHMGACTVGEVPSGSIPGRMLPRMVKTLAI